MVRRYEDPQPHVLPRFDHERQACSPSTRAQNRAILGVNLGLGASFPWKGYSIDPHDGTSMQPGRNRSRHSTELVRLFHCLRSCALDHELTPTAELERFSQIDER